MLSRRLATGKAEVGRIRDWGNYNLKLRKYQSRPSGDFRYYRSSRTAVQLGEFELMEGEQARCTESPEKSNWKYVNGLWGRASVTTGLRMKVR